MFLTAPLTVQDQRNEPVFHSARLQVKKKNKKKIKKLNIIAYWVEQSFNQSPTAQVRKQMYWS